MTDPTPHERPSAATSGLTVASITAPVVEGIKVEQRVQNADISALEAKAPAAPIPAVPAPAVATRTTTTVEDRPATSATTTTTATGVDPPKPATTTRAEDENAAGQRTVTLLWEGTQSVIAVAVTGALIYLVVFPNGVLAGDNLDRIERAFFMVAGFFFGRKPPAMPGGVTPGR